MKGAAQRQNVSDNFRSKAPDAFLPGLLNKADRIPAKSLLFNIDQKATLISKDQNDALLKVFVKVFDESQGYYGNQGHVARFERQLDNRGQYQAFQDAFERISGVSWAQGREQTALEGPSIDRAFTEVDGKAHSGVIQQYSASYSVSIEDFADQVKAWLDKQSDPTFRLNFFVDEVGQFIGSDTKLMLNLQTIAESLNTWRAATRDYLALFWTTMRTDGLLPASVDLPWLIDTTTVLTAAESRLLITRTMGWRRAVYQQWVVTSMTRAAQAAADA